MLAKGNSEPPVAACKKVLPQGGGALHGIGEKFTPDLHTGTGNFAIPITIPPGRNGFQPQLSLVYSTGNGNGPFGLGWNLSIPVVSRKTSDGVPLYNEAQQKLPAPGWTTLAVELAMVFNLVSTYADWCHLNDSISQDKLQLALKKATDADG